MTRQVTWSIVDYSKERTSTSFYIADNDDGTAKSALQTAVQAGTNGVIQKSTDSVIMRLANTYPTNPDAQRERAIEIKYQDNVTLKVYRASIPCPDFSAWDFNTNSDVVNMALAPASTIKTAIEASAKSELGNAVTVIEMRGIGRSS